MECRARKKFNFYEFLSLQKNSKDDDDQIQCIPLQIPAPISQVLDFTCHGSHSHHHFAVSIPHHHTYSQPRPTHTMRIECPGEIHNVLGEINEVPLYFPPFPPYIQYPLAKNGSSGEHKHTNMAMKRSTTYNFYLLNPDFSPI